MNQVFFVILLLSLNTLPVFAQPTTTTTTKTTKETVTFEANKNKVSGFKILKVEKGSVYEKIGLKDGDVIKRYNDKAITNTDEAMEMYNALKDDPKPVLQIERNGKIQEMHYIIK